MKNLPLSLRLFLNVVVFSLPIIVLTYLMYDSQDVNIKFGEKERLGIVLQKPYEELMQAVAKAKLTGDESAIATSQQALESALATVQSELQFTEEGLHSRKREEAYYAKLKEYLAKKQWNEAVQSIKLGIAQLGDTSNLILDPDLDSYYLMDMTLLALPQMQDRILNILADADQLTAADAPQSVQVKSALYAAMLNESDLMRIVADSQTSLNEDANFYGTLDSLQKNIPQTVQSLETKTQDFLKYLNAIAAGEKVDAKAFKQSGFALLDQSYLAWHQTVAELDAVIDVRVKDLSSARVKSLWMAGLALLFAILFSVVVGASVSASIRSILKSVVRLKGSSDETLSIGTLLSDTFKEVSRSLNNQVSSIEQTASSVEEISSMVKTTAENSKEASAVAQKTNQQAVLGEAELNRMQSSMVEIVASSKKIVETITVIDDIAFQTNLLALNASVEAARAGEQGKGFAVVADAVRSLAQKSAVAAKEINELVGGNVEIIEKGRKGAEQSAASLREIITYVRQLNTLIEQIAEATLEQNSGISLISRSIQEIETESDRNQKGLSAVTSSAEELRVQSYELSQIVNHLEAEVLGRKTRSALAPPEKEVKMLESLEG